MQNILRNKFFHLGVLTLLIAFFFMFYNEKAPHAESNDSSVSIAVLDAERIFKESKVFGHIQSQLEERAGNLQAENTTKQEDLQARHQDLESKKNALSQAAYESKMQALKDEFEGVNRETYKEKLILDRAYKKSLKDVDEQFTDIIQKYAQDKDIQIVLNKAQSIYADPTLDVTDEIKGMLDSKMPSYKINFDDFKEVEQQQ